MDTPPPQPYDQLILRQLDRLEERTRDIVTRSDMNALRKELVARDSLEPELTSLRAQIVRVDTDRIADKLAMEKRMELQDTALLSKQDRLWIRVGQVIGVIAFALAVFQLLGHVKILP